MAKPRILICLLRHDLRLSDNPLFHLASQGDHGFSHLLPLFVLSPQQIEVSGFIKDGSPSPYPQAKSALSKVWRTGPHRVKFVLQSVWNLKENLESVGSGLLLRIGKPGDVIGELLEGFSQKQQALGAVWMTSEEGVEEHRDQKSISAICEKLGAEFKLFQDEKYFVDELVSPWPGTPQFFLTR